MIPHENRDHCEICCNLRKKSRLQDRSEDYDLRGAREDPIDISDMETNTARALKGPRPRIKAVIIVIIVIIVVVVIVVVPRYYI